MPLKRRTGELIYFSKFDQKAAYRLLPIRPAHVDLLGFRDNESPPGEWVELRLPFGLASACRMYSCLSNTLGWALQHIVGSGVFCVYLDDFLQINAGKERSVVSSQNTLLTFGILDMPLSDKTDMDVEEIIFLGVGFDSRDETLSVTEKRKGNILRMLDTWLASVKFKTRVAEQNTITPTTRSPPKSKCGRLPITSLRRTRQVSAGHLCSCPNSCK